MASHSRFTTLKRPKPAQNDDNDFNDDDDDLLANVEVPDEPKEKKRKNNYALYMSFQNRDGPRSLGSKVIPEPCHGALNGLSFIITGILESIERDDAIKLIENCGGKMMKTLGKTVKYVVIGRDPGPSKVRKAEEYGVMTLDEDALFQLIRDKSKNVNPKIVNQKTNLKSEESNKSMTKDITKMIIPKNEETKRKTPTKATETNGPHTSLNNKVDTEISEHLWVDKHKPKMSSQIIGQNGDKSCVKKLINWLKHWNENLGKKPGFGKWGNDDGSGFRAALLSGPPGIGKTTAAQLVCKELGYDCVEFNASDTRSKKSLQEEVNELLNNQSLVNFAKKDQSSALTAKRALIMDECDGMAGNEDRGGIQELILLIKKSHIPIICICNDRSHQKMRSLVNYCYDLRFFRPRVEQIKAAMMSLAFKEGIQITSDALHELIVSSNQDIRQVIHYLSLMACGKNGKFNAMLNDKPIKDVKLGPFDALRKVFSTGPEYAKMSFQDKSDLFFTDYSIMPLFVWENYLSVGPVKAKGKEIHKLKLMSQAIDAISYGGIIEKEIRTNNNWSLLPLEAAFASVMPGFYVNGYMGSQIMFPTLLGKMSTINKRDRLLQELKMHMNLKVSGSKTALNLDYLEPLRGFITAPLIKNGNDGVKEVLQRLQYYSLRREDIETIIELSLWNNQTDPMTKVDPKTKAALTRAYNKEGFTLPYSLGTVKKGKGKGMAVKDDYGDGYGDDGDGDGDDAEDDTQDDDIDLDAMIKAKKSTKKNVKSRLLNDDSDGNEKKTKGKQKKPKNTKNTKSPTKGPPKGRSKKK